MGLKEKTLAQKRTVGGVCTVQALEKSLGPKDLKEFEELIDDKSVPAAALARALKAEGRDIEAVTLLRHRNRECKCR